MCTPNVSKIDVDNGNGKRFGPFSFQLRLIFATVRFVLVHISSSRKTQLKEKTSQFFPVPFPLLFFSTFGVHMSFRVPTSCSVATTAVQNPESSSSYEDGQRNGNMDCEKYQKKFVNKDSFNDNR
jgi:hypothetical protein